MQIAQYRFPLADYSKALKIVVGKKNKEQYGILLERMISENFRALAMKIIGDYIERIGEYDVFQKNDNLVTLREFLDFTPLPSNIPICFSNMEIYPQEDKDQGLATHLFEEIIREFETRDAVHIVGFSPIALQRIMPKYSNLGYKKFRVTYENNHSKLATEFECWMYKVYNK